jgi:hypothetical protein
VGRGQPRRGYGLVSPQTSVAEEVSIVGTALRTSTALIAVRPSCVARRAASRPIAREQRPGCFMRDTHVAGALTKGNHGLSDEVLVGVLGSHAGVPFWHEESDWGS